MSQSFYKALCETGIEVNRSSFIYLPEAAQLKVTDDVLMKMFKFISDKYDSIDFSEIEKSAGDITRFKYRDMLYMNASTLMNIYGNSEDAGAKKYIEVAKAIQESLNFLGDRRMSISAQYKQGNGVVQLMYTSILAGCIYALGTLVSNTIRFVTVEQDTEMQVMYDEIPGTIKHVHIKNILAVERDINSFRMLLDNFDKLSKSGKMNESITVSAGVLTALVVTGVILLIPRILLLIREIIYSIYFTRVKFSDMLDVQVQLIRTNIESLEAGDKRNKKKIIVRQKKIADRLESWKNKIAVRMDTTNTQVNSQIRKENAELKLDRDSPFMQNATSSLGNTDLML